MLNSLQHPALLGFHWAWDIVDVWDMFADPNLSGHRKGGEICEQLRALGASLDWDRECFTMDTVSVPCCGPCRCQGGVQSSVWGGGLLCMLGWPEGCQGPWWGGWAEKRLLDVDTQVILGLLSGRDRSFRAALQGWVVVPEPAAGQLVMCLALRHLGY